VVDCESVVVYPGTYDPITLGHLDIIRRALGMFEKVLVLVSENPHKRKTFTLDERVMLVKMAITDENLPRDRVMVDVNTGLTVDYLKSHGYRVMIRGLRAVSDFEYEMEMALVNKHLAPDIETIFLVADIHYQFLRSAVVREIAQMGGPLDGLVTPSVKEYVLKKFAGGDRR